MNILDKIIAHKKGEVAENKSLYPTKLLEQSIYFNSPSVSLKKYLLRPDMNGIIAEFKRKSPSKGIINAYASVDKPSNDSPKHSGEEAWEEAQKESDEQPTRTPRRSAKKEEPKGFDLSQIDRELYHGLESLTDEEKAMITGIDEDDLLTYSVPDDNLIPCGDCQVPSPDTFGSCPACGVMFEEE